MTTLQQYTEWMKALLTVLTDGSYEVKSFATDAERNNVCAYATFTGTHLAGGPVSPTGRTTRTDYVYVMQFQGDKIAHMTKIWNSSMALKELGWALVLSRPQKPWSSPDDHPLPAGRYSPQARAAQKSLTVVSRPIATT